VVKALAEKLPRYKPGDRVRIDDRAVQGHCRAPFFARGHVGEIVLLHGTFRDPERLAYHKPGLPRLPLYKVRLRQRDVWPHYTGAPADTLELDVYENWLTPAKARSARPRP
jgi:nitrile hydratase subunit beta